MSAAPPKAITLTEVEKACKDDPLMQQLKRAIQEEKRETDRMWHTSVLKPFVQIRQELTVTDNNVILRGTRLILLEKHHTRAIEIVHREHLGISKTKQLIREKNLFPGLDKEVEDAMKNCCVCQSTDSPSAERPPSLNTTDLPTGPWHSVAADFAGPLPWESTSW